MPKVIYESIPTLPPVAATIVTVCIYIMLAGLGLWLAATAGIKFAQMVMDAIESEKDLARLQRKEDADEVNFWIHENFKNKRLAAEAHEADQKALAAETRRADLAEHKYQQLLKGKTYLECMEGGKA